MVEQTELTVRDTTGQERTLRLTASMGVAALHERNYSTPEELVLAADRCLYRAKQSGRNKVSKETI